MRIAVTGGTGFIGRRLVRRLAAAGHTVWVVTRRSPAALTAPPPGVRYCTADIRSAASLKRCLEQVAPLDRVYHLAADLDYFGPPSRLDATNVAGTRNVVRWAREAGAGRVLCASSVEALGPVAAAEAPAPPDAPCRPASSYGRSKLRAERAAAMAAREAGIALLVLRLGCVYGPGSAAFIPTLFEALRHDRGIARYLAAVGGHRLPLLHVEDAAAGIAAAEALAPGGRPLLFVPPETVTVAELCAVIAPRAGRPLAARRPVWAVRLALDARTRLQRMRRRADLLGFLTAGGWRRPHRSYREEESLRRAGIAGHTAWREGVHRTLDWHLAREERGRRR